MRLAAEARCGDRADGAAHAPGNGLDPAAAPCCAARKTTRLVRLPKVEQELLQKTERERLGVSFTAMKAAIKEALEAEAKAARPRWTPSPIAS